MSHDDYVQNQKNRVVEVSTMMLNGEMDLIEGTRLLTTLRWEVTEDQFDQDFLLFVGIDSETDALPIGEERLDWADYALAEKDVEIKRIEDYYRDKIFAACRVLVERFGQYVDDKHVS